MDESQGGGILHRAAARDRHRVDQLPARGPEFQGEPVDRGDAALGAELVAVAEHGVGQGRGEAEAVLDAAEAVDEVQPAAAVDPECALAKLEPKVIGPFTAAIAASKSMSA